MKRVLAVILSVIVLAGCMKRNHQQNEDQAIAVTNLFLKAMVQGNYQEAYGKYLSASVKKIPGMSLGSFVTGFEAMVEEHGPITKAVFDSYQAVPGQNAIQLYYRVTHEKDGEILYHVVLEGHASIGYNVFIMDIGNHVIYPPGLGENEAPARLRKSGVTEVQLK